MTQPFTLVLAHAELDPDSPTPRRIYTAHVTIVVQAHDVTQAQRKAVQEVCQGLHVYTRPEDWWPVWCCPGVVQNIAEDML
jgi:maltose-binding protein MalE